MQKISQAIPCQLIRGTVVVNAPLRESVVRDLESSSGYTKATAQKAVYDAFRKEYRSETGHNLPEYSSSEWRKSPVHVVLPDQ